MLKKVYWFSLSLVLVSVVMLQGVQATENESEDDDSEDSVVQSIFLKKSGDYSKVEWESEGESEFGFKVVYSKEEMPTYPTRDGDKYQYFSEKADGGSATLDAFDGAGTYYARVCEYLGGECGVYSNQITIELDGRVYKEEVKTKCEFEDVDDDNKMCEHLRIAKKNGIASENLRFNPEQSISRGQFAAVLFRAFDVTSDTTGESFSDVPVGHTFYEEVLSLKNLGVFSGDDGKFYPDAPLTRGQAVKAVLNTLEGLDLFTFPEAEDEDLEDDFKDVNLDRHTFSKYIKRMWKATKNDSEPVFKGYSDGHFYPDKPITRIQAMKLIVNAMRLVDMLDSQGLKVGNYVKGEKSIELEVEDDAVVAWESEGESEFGFKVVYSKEEMPTYPTRDGDKYQYFSAKADGGSATLDAFDGAGTYYARVCEYLGGKCGVYSNQVEVEL